MRACLLGATVVLVKLVLELTAWSGSVWKVNPFLDLAGATIPVALLGAMLRRRSAEAAVTDVFAGAAEATPVGLRDALRATLLDPTLEVRLRDEVLAMLAEGRSNVGIGHRLFLAPKSVERHIAAVFAKLGLDPGVEDNRRVLAALHYLRADRPF